MNKLPKSSKMFWEQDMTELYRNQKNYMKLILYQRENPKSYEYMMSKSPVHSIHLDNLHAVFPDSVFIWTHRDPKDVICSTTGIFLFGSLFETPSKCDMRELGKSSFDFIHRVLRQGLEKRKLLEEKGVKIVDFYYSDFIKDPVNAISDLYEQLNLEFTDETANNIKQYHQCSLEQRKNRRKPIKFTLDEIGLNAQEVDESFEYYYKQYPNLKH